MTEALMTVCIVCGSPIAVVNDSREHIIPNAIGGRRKISGFICRACNGGTGYSWDAELARQLNALCLFFDIARERGESPREVVQTSTGEKYVMRSGGGFSLEKPRYSTVPTDGGVALTLVARDMREARKLLKGVKRKFDNIDVENLLENASPQYSYPAGMLHLSPMIGGPLSGRSIVKTAAAVARDAAIPIDQCDVALAYLRTDSTEHPYGFFYEQDLVIDRPPEIPLHCAAVAGDGDTGLLLGYVEYFGIFRMVVCLSKSYRGRKLSHSYAINPVNGEALSLAVRMQFEPGDIQDIYDYKRAPNEARQAAFAAVIPAALRRQAQREEDRVMADAFKYAGEACGLKEGDIIPPEIAPQFARFMTERMMPYLMHRVGRRLLSSDPHSVNRDASDTAIPEVASEIDIPEGDK